jgi:hypothetical protein
MSRVPSLHIMRLVGPKATNPSPIGIKILLGAYAVRPFWAYRCHEALAREDDIGQIRSSTLRHHHGLVTLCEKVNL